MTHPVTGIDHVLIIGTDLDASAAQYAAMGFTLSPRGIHPPSKGTANHTIMLGHDYIELLGLIEETELNRPRYQAVMQNGSGLHAVCCRITDALAAAPALAALGITTEVPNSFERPVPLPDGSTGRAAFSTLNFPPSDIPIGLLFMCQHKTPETVWLPDLMQHPNTATGIAALRTLSDQPEADAAHFARYWRDAVVETTDFGLSITTGENSARLDLCTREGLEKDYPAAWIDATAKGGHAVLQVGVADLDAAKASLTKAGTAHQTTPSGIAIAPDLAGGVIVEFVAA